MMKKFNLKILIPSLLLPLLVGMVSAALSMSGMADYGNMRKPPLSPPAWVFSVAWTILYLMMGLASYFIMIEEQNSTERTISLRIYLIQLIMNFFWSIIFFNLHMYLFAFLWLFIMLCLVALCTYQFFNIKKTAGFLMIPYVGWLVFAGYLNMGAYVLDKVSVS